MPTSVYFNNQEAAREQILLEDMVIESIKNHGIDIYYMPRSSRDFPAGQLDDYSKHVKGIDDLFGDDPIKLYDSAYKIDMYLETFNDYGGQQEFFSKFGLQVEKTARVAVARRTFEKYVLAERNMPKEGDLIYMPAQRKLMEIRFVERDVSFFQLGKRLPYMYVLSLETFKYNGELLNTGIEEIDFVCDDTALSTNFVVDTATMSAESFTRGEIAWQGPPGDFANANTTGIVTNFNRTTSSFEGEYVDGPVPAETLRIRNIKGSFVIGDPIYGFTTGASANLVSYNILETATEGEIMDNWQIEQEADTYLDFSESNPFGEP